MSIAQSTRALAVATALFAASGALASSFDAAEYTRAAALAQTLPSSPALKPDQRLQLLSAAATLSHWASEAPLTPSDRAQAWAYAAQAAVALADQPRAVMCYRRALLADPLNASARAGLLQSRARLESSLAPTPPTQSPEAPPTSKAAKPAPEFTPTPLETTRSLLAHLPAGLLPTISFAALLASSLGVAVLIASRRRPHWLIPAGAIAALLGLLTGAAALVSSWPSLTSRDAVVIATGLQPRSAPGYAAAPSSAPHPAPGVELRVLDSTSIRDETWVQVFTINQPLSPPYWIPADAIEPIIPPVHRSPG